MRGEYPLELLGESKLGHSGRAAPSVAAWLARAPGLSANGKTGPCQCIGDTGCVGCTEPRRLTFAVGGLDPRGGRQCAPGGQTMDRAFGTRGVDRGEDVGTSSVARVSQLVMHVEEGVHPEPAVEMRQMVPAKAVFAVRACVFDRAEPRRGIRAIPERVELRPRVRIVVRDGVGECDVVTPRSSSKSATGCESIDDPRFAWSVRGCGPTCSRVRQVAVSRSANSADSPDATIRPTGSAGTHRGSRTGGTTTW